MIQVAGVGQLMGQNVAHPLRRGDGGGGQIDGGPEQPEQAGGGQPCLHQIDGQGTALHRPGLPGPPQPQPEAPVDGQQKHRRRAAPRQPEAGQHRLRGQPPVLHGGLLRLDQPCRSPFRDLRLFRGHVGGGGVLGQRGTGHRNVDRPGGNAPGHPLLHRLGRSEDGKIHRRQAHRNQQPQEDQSPQSVLHPPGQAGPEQLPQRQQRQNQHR